MGGSGTFMSHALVCGILQRSWITPTKAPKASLDRPVVLHTPSPVISGRRSIARLVRPFMKYLGDSHLRIPVMAGTIIVVRGLDAYRNLITSLQVPLTRPHWTSSAWSVFSGFKPLRTGGLDRLILIRRSPSPNRRRVSVSQARSSRGVGPERLHFSFLLLYGPKRAEEADCIQVYSTDPLLTRISARMHTIGRSCNALSLTTAASQAAK